MNINNKGVYFKINNTPTEIIDCYVGNKQIKLIYKVVEGKAVLVFANPTLNEVQAYLGWNEENGEYDTEYTKEEAIWCDSSIWGDMYDWNENTSLSWEEYKLWNDNNNW